MRKPQQLLIVLPESLADIPVKIVKNMASKEIVVRIVPSEKDSAEIEKCKYACIRRSDDHLFVPLDDIVWIKADGSYADLHLTDNQTLKVSFNLAVVEKELPASDFVRIYHSHIVNLKHIESMKGNKLHIDGQDLTLGREYKPGFFEHVIFIGVRRNKEKE